MVGIIDYGMGNIFSIQNACKFAGIKCEITSESGLLKKYDAVIIPGVGSYGDATDILNKNGMFQAIKEFKNTGKYVLGICLGMQLMTSRSYEFGIYQGLEFLEGECSRFPNTNNNEKVDVPQITWNKIYFEKDKNNTHLFDGINQGEYMYFIHSYYVKLPDDKYIVTRTEYGGIQYCSSFIKDNIVGMQFHPEKSGGNGLLIYKNFNKMVYNKD